MSEPVTDTAPSSPSATTAACTAAILSPPNARSSARLSVSSQHPFFRWLRDAPASAPDAQYFRQHFLPSATMCSCTVFPAYNTKIDLQLPSNPSARRFLQCMSNLCLYCIEYVTQQERLAPCKRYWTPTLAREFTAFYSKPGCFKVSRASFLLWSSITKQQHNEKERELQRRVVPIMGQHGWQLNDDGVSWSRRTSLARAS